MNYTNIAGFAKQVGEFIPIRYSNGDPLSKKDENYVLKQVLSQNFYFNRVPGWEHGTPYWTDIDKIQTKQADGTEYNPIRAQGTVEDDSLESDVAKGLKLTVAVCSVKVDDNGNIICLDWFNRLREFKKQGYTRIIVCPYYQVNPTKWQDTEEKAIRQFQAVANRRTGQKVIRDEDILELLRVTFDGTYDDILLLKDDMVDFLTSLDLGLSSQEIKGKANTVVRERQRQGNVEYFSRKDAEAWKADWWKNYESKGPWDTEPEICNAADSTRALRLWIQIMDHYIKTGEVYHFMTFDSSAVTHDGLDKGVKDLNKELRDIQKKVVKYVHKLHEKAGVNKLDPTWNIIGSIPQKIEEDGTKNVNCYGFQD